MKKTDNNSRTLKWEQNGELAHKDLSELLERLKMTTVILVTEKAFFKPIPI